MIRYIFKSFLKITILAVIVILIISLLILTYLKCIPVESPLPKINYIGMNKFQVIDKLLKDNVKYQKFDGVYIGYSGFPDIRLEDRNDIKKSKMINNSIWNVNFMHAGNKIKNGNYYYKLQFDENGTVKEQEECFNSDIGIFGL